MKEVEQIKLPENAMRPLRPGETYNPVISPESKPREVTFYSVTMGLVMAIIFSAATALSLIHI